MKIFPIPMSICYACMLGFGAACFATYAMFPEQMHTVLIPDFSIFGIPQGITTIGSIFICGGIVAVGTLVLSLLADLLRTTDCG